LDGHSHGQEEPEGKSSLDEPVKSPEGSAEEDESQSESGDSDSSSSGEDDSDELAALEDKPLAQVPEEMPGQDVQDVTSLDVKPSTEEAGQDGRDEAPTRREAPSKRRHNHPPWPVSPVMSIDDVAV
jgi:hypothetical protein